MFRDRSGEELVITGLLSQYEKTLVYNLDVEGYHNYAVTHGGILGGKVNNGL
jgi:hypothetical protein